jgi:acyl CoA:acetate/3-ketoacid CoA transferase beta subunit
MTTTTSAVTRADYCVIACAEAWRGDGEILASPMGTIPMIGARLARLTFAPDLLLTDGEALLVADVTAVSARPQLVEGWLPYRQHLELVTTGRRHVMMGASQIDRYGNQNISCIGDWARPARQLLGVRGAPVNSSNNPTSYFVGFDRAVGPFHGLRRVVSDLGVFDFDTPDRAMRLASVHPGVTVEQVVAATSFPLVLADEVPFTREPTAEELQLIREVLDPKGWRLREVRG